MRYAPWALFILIFPLLTYASDESNFRKKTHQDASIGLHTNVISETQTVGKDRTRLWYSVCNLASKGLIFRWVQADFENGWSRPLTQDECAIYSVEVMKSRLDGDTDILYTQRGEKYGAAAFIPDDKSLMQRLTEWVTSIGEVATGHDYKHPDEYYDLKVIGTNKGRETRNEFSWSQNVDTIILKLMNEDEKTLKYIDDQLLNQKNPSLNSARLSAKELNSTSSENDQTSREYPDGEYIRLQTKEGGERNAVIYMPLGERTTNLTTPVYALDKKGQPIWIIQLRQ